MPATEVWPGLFIGSFNEGDHLDFAGVKIFVLEQRSGLPSPPLVSKDGVLWMPVLDWENRKVIPAHLDAVHAVIDDSLKRGRNCMVFCGQGVERSPLVAVTYIKTKTVLSLDEIYEAVRKLRPQVERREGWL